MQKKLLRIINVDFGATRQLLIINSAFVKYLSKIKGKDHNSQTRQYLYSILIIISLWAISVGDPTMQ